ncbi:LuxR family transcriptional regulator [Paractinoplanes deccanensis]|uniref:LuxR family transcriptional regulator n=1 Tax=Paractinoplanes deccanensis TaxID=113561 RepID=A0ABQ3YJQ8_9ACTN|nr:LuxR family transcriptional regulator [Actinoplanes deccanensis]GID80244.1 LuxR family transcriptional regulator [Actinoplanes deccanensis]
MSLDHPLLGREADIEAIEAFLAAAADTGGAMLLTGAPGTGRTALLELAARRAAAAELRVLRVPGTRHAAGGRFAGLDGLLTPLGTEMAVLPPTVRTALLVTLGLAEGPEPGLLALGTATLSLLRLAGQAQPVMVLADDADRLDQASAEVLAFVARRLTGSRVALLATMRTGSPRALAGAGLPSRHVRPLDDSAASLMMHARWPDLAVRVQHRLLAIAQGNPRALAELPAALSPSQRAGRDALPTVLPLTDGLRAMHSARIEQLPAATQEPLLLTALESSGNLAVLQAAAPHTDLLEALAPAERAGLIEVDVNLGRVAFSPPLVRSAVVALAAPVAQRRAHRALAAALPHRPEQRVWHLAGATVVADEEVAALLEQSARDSVRRGETVEAVAALGRAAELSPTPGLRARRLLEAAYLGADVVGDLSKASQWLHRADADRSGLVESLPATVAAAQLLVNAEARAGTAHDLLAGAVEAYSNRSDPHDTVLIDALHSLLLSSWVSGQPAAWEPVVAAVARLDPSPPPVLELCARTFGDPVRLAEPMLALAETRADALRDELNPVVISRVAIGCVYIDRLAACREALDRVIADGRAGGAVGLGISATVSNSVDNWHTGRWAEGDRLAADGIALCRQYNYPRYSYILQYFRCLFAAAGGDVEDTLATVDEMTRWATPRGAGITVQFSHHVRALVYIGAGDYDKAFHEAAAISPAGILAPYEPHALWVLLDLVESAVRSGRTAEARAHVAVMRHERIDRLSSRLALVSAGCAALVAADDDAATGFQRALAVPGAEHWPFDRARIQLAYGEHLRRTRRVNAAQSQLREALETFERLGARPWARRAAAELRAGGTAAPTPSPITAPLSERELRIARLAASGLNNRQIGEKLHMSHRTVGGYLYKLFPKLGITSRAALRDRLADLPDRH